MQTNIFHAMRTNFLGNTSQWYKNLILAFLVINPVLWFSGLHFISGWVLIAEFIFTLAMALKCYPLQPGGLLALEAVILCMTTPDSVMHEVEANLEVILLLVFMVAGIHFMRDLLLFTFTRILLVIRSKVALSFLFCFVAAICPRVADRVAAGHVICGKWRTFDDK